MDKFWIGMLGRAMKSISVERAQDVIFSGKGTIYMPDESNPSLIHGINTQFIKQIKPRSSICLPKDMGTAEVAQVISDTEILLCKPMITPGAVACLRVVDESGNMPGTVYKISPHVDQSRMFSEVTRRLSHNGAVGIFPEGGSHDRPELLPLKAGVAIMALDAVAKHPNLPLKIVPCGLSYFHADKFRSRAVIEYGDPIEIPSELLEQYKNGGTDKRKAISLLLDTIEVSLKSLTLQSPDFDTLMVVQAVRRLYTPVGKKLDLDQTLAMSRNFAEGYIRMRDNPEVKALTQQVLQYDRLLKYYGVLDHQVKNTNISSMRALCLFCYRAVEMLVFFILSLPVLILFSPLLFLSRMVSKKMAAEALAGSSVKISGNDVVTTWKLLTAMVVLPTLSTVYVIISYILARVYFTSSYTAIAIAVLTSITIPTLGFVTIRMSDIGMDILKSLPPLMVSLTTPKHSTKQLREVRAELSANITALVSGLGPQVFPNFEKKRVVSHDEALLSIYAAQKMRRSSALNDCIKELPPNVLDNDMLSSVNPT
ncbi:Glycerol-3-phosphate/dihydroxyacetone phosphate acyltransferase, variant 4 [Batrachochytrium dendrobatidis]